jgi:hypothetical protein
MPARLEDKCNPVFTLGRKTLGDASVLVPLVPYPDFTDGFVQVVVDGEVLPHIVDQQSVAFVFQTADPPVLVTQLCLLLIEEFEDVQRPKTGHERFACYIVSDCGQRMRGSVRECSLEHTAKVGP